mgnify:CR=1 FL=1
MIKRLIQLTLNKFGYEIKKLNNNFSMEAAISRVRERGIDINTVIDIGASDGRWSEKCMKYYPDAYYFLIEAQQPHELGLKEFKNRHPNADYIMAAAGDRNGTTYFDDTDLFGGVVLTGENPDFSKVKMVRTDEEVKKRNLRPPYLIKLDTHGFEVPILEGATEILKDANLLIIEAYNFQLNSDSLKFADMVKYMENLGFYPIEMADLLLREKDRAFWQMDIFFIKSSRKEFQTNTYN